ncbi:NAD(P)-binding domain-containing protein [Kutzneria sp. CA-103260]|uniref:NAD(P)-binding domain-containing protein n=1 Tax=Kutzneria sp. CA-103260 TaxID=2802641 RepID=UPI001BAA7ADF|nr:NAD(P)-binding domain-containing protein [Kutzneria sp. CA-103260]QUQ65053.1 NAD(P)-dependent oxidoreductase [Kutzneria sp. CA-103260]
MITVLGLGPMGQALASAFVANGRPTTVWSRSATTPTPAGAVRAATPAAAVEGSELTIVCVRGEAALQAVLEPIGGGTWW